MSWIGSAHPPGQAVHGSSQTIQMTLTTRLTFLILLVLLQARTGHASPPQAHLSQTDAALTLDGLATEAFWQDSPVFKDFSVYEPNVGIEQRVNAEAKMVIGPNALYVYVRVDAGEAPIFAPYATRDGSPGDRVVIQIDPFGTGRRGYVFRVNARGVLADARLTPGRGADNAWDSLFDAATVQKENGAWAAEIKIPFQSLRFDPKQKEWLAHIFVHSWFHQQAISWAPIDRHQNNWLIQAGRITGFSGQQPGRDIELMPTVATSWNQDEDGMPACGFGANVGSFEVCGAQLDYGLGLKWGITPSMTFDAVFNPDFSQVEADPGILDLNSRFSIRLPERRPFFLEGADIFQTDYEVFYSRSVVQPDSALKLTGRQGDVRVGALSAFDPREDGGYAATEVGRLQLDLGGNATLGTMFVQRDDIFAAENILSNTVGGLDGQAFLFKRINLEGEFFFSRVHEKDTDPSLDVAGKARAVYKTDNFRLQTHYRMVGDNFRSDAGFIPRTGFHEGFIKADAYYRGDGFWARNISPGIWTRYNVSPQGEREDRVFGMNNFWRFGERMWLFGRLEHFGELVRWEIDEDTGEEGSVWTESTEFALMYGTSTLQWLDGNAGMVVGQTPIRDPDLFTLANRDTPFVGWRYGPRANIVLRPTHYLTLMCDYNHFIFMDEREGEILGEQPVVRTQGRFFFTRNFNLRYINQWQPYKKILINDALLSYVPMPGTVFFAGFRQTDALDNSAPVERAVFLKYSVLFSF